VPCVRPRVSAAPLRHAARPARVHHRAAFRSAALDTIEKLLLQVTRKNRATRTVFTRVGTIVHYHGKRRKPAIVLRVTCSSSFSSYPDFRSECRAMVYASRARSMTNWCWRSLSAHAPQGLVVHAQLAAVLVHVPHTLTTPCAWYKIRVDRDELLQIDLRRPSERPPRRPRRHHPVAAAFAPPPSRRPSSPVDRVLHEDGVRCLFPAALLALASLVSQTAHRRGSHRPSACVAPVDSLAHSTATRPDRQQFQRFAILPTRSVTKMLTRLLEIHVIGRYRESIQPAMESATASVRTRTLSPAQPCAWSRDKSRHRSRMYSADAVFADHAAMVVLKLGGVGELLPFQRGA